MLTAHGFNDWNVMPSHTALMVEAVKANGTPVQRYWHQGGNGGEPRMAMMNRGFTRYLLGVQNGVEKDPRAFIPAFTAYHRTARARQAGDGELPSRSGRSDHSRRQAYRRDNHVE